MKKLNINQNVLSAGIALALGITFNSAHAATTSGSVSPTAGSVSITNTATASYSVDGVAQPTVTSNAVTVNINENASFTLVATQGSSSTDDKNENRTLTVPTGATTFINTLTNTGNVADTYTITLSDAPAGIITGVTDKFGFTDETTTIITVTIKNADNTVASTTTITSGGTVKLLPGQYAELSYALTADGTGMGGDSGLATLTAKSAYITPLDSTKATLTNENQAILKLPVFAITKTATTTNIDLNVASPTIDYTITVKNDGSATYAADAIGVLIQDKLPTGLTVSGGAAAITVTSTDGTTTNGTAPQVLAAADGTQIIAVNGVDLKVNEIMTITFKAAVDKTKIDANKSLVNNADVYDNYTNTPVTPGETPTSDIKDSTATSDASGAKVPNDPTGTGTGGDTPATVTFTTRGLTMTGGATAQLPTTSSSTAPATYTQTITNTGNNPESNLTFTITDPNTGDKITPQNVIYDPTPGVPGDEVGLTPLNGVYTIPGSIQPNKSATISYDVVTTGATPNTSETNVVTLTPATVSGTTTPTVTPVQNTTIVKDMSLLKEQALDASCDGTPDSAFGTTSVTATPTQCVIYRITATNNFTSKSLSNVVISDVASQWSSKATYVPNSISDSVTGTGSSKTGTVTAPGTEAKSSTMTLGAGGTGVLTFSIKINQ